MSASLRASLLVFNPNPNSILLSQYDVDSRLRSALVKIRASVPRFITKDTDCHGQVSFRPLLSRLYPHGDDTPCPKKLFVSVVRSVASCCNLEIPDIALLADVLGHEDDSGGWVVDSTAICGFLGCGKDGDVSKATILDELYKAASCKQGPLKGSQSIKGYVDGLKTYRQLPKYRKYDPTRAECSSRNLNRPKTGLWIPGDPKKKKKKSHSSPPPRTHPCEKMLETEQAYHAAASTGAGGVVKKDDEKLLKRPQSQPSSQSKHLNEYSVDGQLTPELADRDRPMTAGAGLSTFPQSSLEVRRHSVPASMLVPQKNARRVTKHWP